MQSMQMKAVIHISMNHVAKYAAFPQLLWLVRVSYRSIAYVFLVQDESVIHSNHTWTEL